MPTPLPTDEIILERTLRATIRQFVLSIGVLSPENPDPIPAMFMPHVYDRQRFADSDEEDEAISTKPDPVVVDAIRTNIIEIGTPKVAEAHYAGTNSTQLTFTYPLIYELETVDMWDNNGVDPLRFTNSSDLFIAVYMKARRAFKRDMRLGFENCEHKYLQQESALVITDEETKGSLHSADWSIQIEALGILV